ncbi:MAG: hypothetical protein L0H83_07795, partial [Salinisphaera sp.]|nr:hypothetical protein [Salinisphaera sp.]
PPHPHPGILHPGGPDPASAPQLARDRRYGKFMRFMGHVSRSSALEAQQNADLLLLLEDAAPEARGVLTGKLFEYTTAGKPILCVGSSPEYEIVQVLQATSTGRVFGPEEYDQPAVVPLETVAGSGLYDAYRPSLDAIMRYSRERQARRMLNVVTND